MLGTSFDDTNSVFNVPEMNFEKESLDETKNHPLLEKPCNTARLLDGRYESKFVSSNVINLSKCHLSKDEMFLLSKALYFFQSLNILIKHLLKKKLKFMPKKLG